MIRRILSLYGVCSIFFGLIFGTCFAESNLQKIIVVRKDGKIFKEVLDQISHEMKKYKIEDFLITEETSYEEFSKKIIETHPQLMVLMDNKSVELGIKWNQKGFIKLPGVALMGLNFQTLLKHNMLIAGIAFEPPAYTLLTKYRYFFDVKPKKVLVFYRKSLFEDTIQQAKQQLSIEKIELQAINIEQRGMSTSEITQFLLNQGKDYLENKSKYDVIWCLLDSVMLSQDLFAQFWTPYVVKNKIPVVTGVEQLVTPSLDFAVFAVTPNLSDLASQAAQIAERILSDHENPAGIGIQQIISVDHVANLKKSNQLGIHLQDERISNIKVLK
jgi:arsenate reductase-like glutaredoxin family protein